MKYKFFIFAFVITFGAFIVSYGSSEECRVPTIIKGMVFLNGSLLNKGVMEVYVNNSYDGKINIIDGIYVYGLNNIPSGRSSEVVLKIYANNTFLKEESFSISCGDYVYLTFTLGSTPSQSNVSQNLTTNSVTSISEETITPSQSKTQQNLTTNNVTSISEETITPSQSKTQQNLTTDTKANITVFSNQSNQDDKTQHNISQINMSSLRDNESNETTRLFHTDFMAVLLSVIAIALLLVLISLILKKKQHL